MAEVVVGAAALLAFAATSAPSSEPENDSQPADPDVPGGQDQRASLVLHNGLSTAAVVRLRQLDPAVDVDCAAILEDPGALLSEPLLGLTQSWTIPAGDNLGIDATLGRACEVLRIEGDGLAPRWVVWEPSLREPQLYRADEEPTGSSVLRLSPEGSGITLVGPEDLLFTPAELERGTEQCAPVADGQRVEWGDPLPSGGLLASATWGPDGCGSIVFSDEAEVLGSPWYICVPEDAWPFTAGDDVAVASLFASGADGVDFRTDDGRRMIVVRTSETTTLEPLTVTYARQESCGYDVEPRCGTVSRVGRVEVTATDGSSVFMDAGEVAAEVSVPGSTTLTRLEVLAAQERVALDPECALGPDVLGPDMALVVTQSEVEG